MTTPYIEALIEQINKNPQSIADLNPLIPKARVWFTADTHFRHRNACKFWPYRAVAGKFNSKDDDAHNQWLRDLWNSTVGKEDLVFIIGDFALGTPNQIRYTINGLNGRKVLIKGNHDQNVDKYSDCFDAVTQIGRIVFKKSDFGFLNQDLTVFMCHYPMVTWPQMSKGAVHLHGHCHGELDICNRRSRFKRFDVGIDSELGAYGLVSLEKLYDELMLGELNVFSKPDSGLGKKHIIVDYLHAEQELVDVDTISLFSSKSIIEIPSQNEPDFRYVIDHYVIGADSVEQTVSTVTPMLYTV